MTREFFSRFENFVIERNLQKKVDLADIKNTIFKDLDDLIAAEDEVELGKKIGVGASSEVYYGNFKFCPCAVKKIKLNLMNAKQLVSNHKLTLLRNLSSTRYPV